MNLSSNPAESNRIWEGLQETLFPELFGEKCQALSSDPVIYLEREAASADQVSCSLTTCQVNKGLRKCPTFCTSKS